MVTVDGAATKESVVAVAARVAAARVGAYAHGGGGLSFVVIAKPLTTDAPRSINVIMLFPVMLAISRFAGVDVCFCTVRW